MILNNSQISTMEKKFAVSPHCAEELADNLVCHLSALYLLRLNKREDKAFIHQNANSYKNLPHYWLFIYNHNAECFISQENCCARVVLVMFFLS